MIIVCKQGATADQLESLRKRMVELGLNFEEMPGDYQTVFGVRGDVSKVNKGQIEVMDAVQEVKLISLPYKTIARQVEGHTKDRNTVQIEGINMGGPKVVVIAGPCSVSDKELLKKNCDGVKTAGADIFRGCPFKPRTSPWDWQGSGLDGLELLEEIAADVKIPIAAEATGTFRFEMNGTGNKILTSVEATEILAKKQIPVLEQIISRVHLPWIGARSAFHYDFLQEAALVAIKYGKPLMLKRGPAMTFNEYLLALEYVAMIGCQVIACVRGAGADEIYRNRPDIEIIRLLKEHTTVTVVADPSHMSGAYKYVPDLAHLALEAGADGLIIEASADREKELTDGKQAISMGTLEMIVKEANAKSRV